jgi:hypothetical protein
MDAVDTVASWVAARGADREQACLIADYIADRCAGLSIASVHSSEHSSLVRDDYLVRQLGLSRRQVTAWLALIRGTRAVHRDGKTYGGCPGLVESIASGRIGPRERRRFERLAHMAATGHRPQPARIASGLGVGEVAPRARSTRT